VHCVRRDGLVVVQRELVVGVKLVRLCRVLFSCLGVVLVVLVCGEPLGPVWLRQAVTFRETACQEVEGIGGWGGVREAIVGFCVGVVLVVLV
jgi:hypothetical protein